MWEYFQRIKRRTWSLTSWWKAPVSQGYLHARYCRSDNNWNHLEMHKTASPTQKFCQLRVRFPEFDSGFDSKTPTLSPWYHRGFLVCYNLERSTKLIGQILEDLLIRWRKSQWIKKTTARFLATPECFKKRSWQQDRHLYDPLEKSWNKLKLT